MELLQHGIDTVVVVVNKNELMCDGGKLLPYPAYIGTISRRTGRVTVWSPAAYKPRGYKSAAKRLLEYVASSGLPPAKELRRLDS